MYGKENIKYTEGRYTKDIQKNDIQKDGKMEWHKSVKKIPLLNSNHEISLAAGNITIHGPNEWPSSYK